MNIEADPLGYKLMSSQLSAVRETDAEIASHLRSASTWLRFGVLLLLALAIGMGLTLLHAARFVMAPVVAGVVVGLILGPIGDRGWKRGIPRWVTFSLLVVFVMAGLAAIALMLVPVAQAVVDSIPQAIERFSLLTHRLQNWASTLTLPGASVALSEGRGVDSSTSTVEIATNAVTIVSPVVSQIMIFLFTLILFLATRQETKSTVVMAFGKRESRLAALRAFSSVENRLTDYFLAITLVNAGLGLVVAGTFMALDVSNALTWGFVAFSLNYLPVIGPLLVKAALLVFGILIQPTAFDVLAPLMAFLLISLVEANLVTPRIVGNKITMNPLLVFLSVVFWTWMWGFSGAFLAMPLLAIASAILSTLEEPSRLPE